MRDKFEPKSLLRLSLASGIGLVSIGYPDAVSAQSIVPQFSSLLQRFVNRHSLNSPLAERWVEDVSAELQSARYPIRLRLNIEMPARIRITDLARNGQEILALTPVTSSQQTVLLRVNLDCRRNIDNRHILVEVFAEGIRFAEAVRGNFCLLNDDGHRTIAVYLARTSPMFPEADRFNAYQEVVHGD